MTSPYNAGGTQSGGFRTASGTGKIRYMLPLDNESGTGVKPEHYPAPRIVVDMKKSHVRPGWTGGFSL